jgi:HTH-type transcriptional regulator / antitoxin HipB
MPNEPKDEAITPRRVRTAADVGEIVRKTRRRTGTDQSTAAGLVGVGVRFLGDLEHGKPTARLGLVLQVLDGLGLEVWIGPRGWRREP